MKKYFGIYILLLIIMEGVVLFYKFDVYIPLFSDVVNLNLFIIFNCVVLLPIIIFEILKNKLDNDKVNRNIFFVCIIILIIILVFKIVFISSVNNDLKKMCKNLENMDNYSTMSELIKSFGIVNEGKTVKETVNDYIDEFENFEEIYQSKQQENYNVFKRSIIIRDFYIWSQLRMLMDSFKEKRFNNNIDKQNEQQNYYTIQRMNLSTVEPYLDSEISYKNYLYTSHMQVVYENLFAGNKYYKVEENAFIYATIFELISMTIMFIIFRRNNLIEN